MMTTLANAIEQWLRSRVEASGASGIALGLSGGIDSAVVVTLAVRAIGVERVTGIIMPAHSQQSDIDDARLVANGLGLEPLLVDLSDAFDTLVATLPPGSELAAANIKPRLRMITLYHVANTNNLLVSGTGNKSELLAGYFTKYGDGGVDMLPLGSLYKHEVRELARAIGVPEKIINRPPSAGLWAGQTDEEEMGITYEELDGILAALESGGDLSDFAPNQVENVRTMIRRSEHKRNMPPVFEVSEPISMLEMA